MDELLHQLGSACGKLATHSYAQGTMCTPASFSNSLKAKTTVSPNCFIPALAVADMTSVACPYLLHEDLPLPLSVYI